MQMERTSNILALASYYNACKELAELFCKKHDFYPLDGQPDFCSEWVADRPGEILAAADYFFDMEVIVDDLSLDAPEECLLEWYDYVTALPVGKSRMNYRTWLRKRR